ncbi:MULTISPECIES: LysR substrate-binding domain-containing protein [unclassified Pseudomonas]|uniref:LysR family transcriptional regulator n=1 Tax=unclassified Pseudomonas TaxID=196821 RepID=UPI0035C0ADDF
MDRIDTLRLLLDVADSGSFSAVARARSIATSTVALAITQLEDEFATRLLIRSTRKLTFTHEGETLLQDARRIVAEWDAAIYSLRDNGPLTGPLRVTATNDFGRVHVRPLLDAFQQQHPGVHITLLLNDGALDLIENHIDLAIRSGPLPDSTLRARRLIQGPRLVCASPEYWRRAGKPKHPRDLAAHNCIILARPGAPISTWPFREGEKQFSVKVHGDRSVSDGDMIRQWGIEGRGVILKNYWDIEADLHTKRLEAVLEDFTDAPVDLYAVTPAGGATSRRLNALVDFIVEGLALKRGG